MRMEAFTSQMFGLLSFRFWISTADAAFRDPREETEERGSAGMASDRSDNAPLSLWNVSNKLHLLSTIIWKIPTEQSSDEENQTWPSPSQTKSRPTLKVSSPAAHQNRSRKWRGKKKARAKKDEWWNWRCLSCNALPHLCVLKVIYSKMEQQVLRFRGYTIWACRAVKGGNGDFLMCFTLMFVGSLHLEKHSVTDGIPHTHTHTATPTHSCTACQ